MSLLKRKVSVKKITLVTLLWASLFLSRRAVIEMRWQKLQPLAH
jgi:hypothetical protein